MSLLGSWSLDVPGLTEIGLSVLLLPPAPIPQPRPQPPLPTPRPTAFSPPCLMHPSLAPATALSASVRQRASPLFSLPLCLPPSFPSLRPLVSHDLYPHGHFPTPLSVCQLSESLSTPATPLHARSGLRRPAKKPKPFRPQPMPPEPPSALLHSRLHGFLRHRRDTPPWHDHEATARLIRNLGRASAFMNNNQPLQLSHPLHHFTYNSAIQGP